jgi:hypothetical protein
MDMQAITLDNQTKFSLRGTCPHAAHESAFLQVTGVHQELINMHPQGPLCRLVCGMECQGCLRYILGIVLHQQNSASYRYEAHYPLGRPNDDVAEEIPTHIQPDFKEALRCLFVDAYNATAEMCRRALEASCIDLGASADLVLEKQIDWLASQGKITEFMRQVAHKIRLGGNRGAHPSAPVPEATEIAIAAVSEAAAEPAPIKVITKEHAEAIVKFSREFFNHVYVVPKQMDKYDFSKPKGIRPTGGTS